MLEKILNQKTLISVILLAVLIGGIISYTKLGKLEDAEIPMKTVMIITQYPGATAHEVELEVSDVLEKALQKLENIDIIKSVSQPDLSLIKVDIQPKIKTNELPQLYDHLRRKINDAKASLPSGAKEPIINDDFADTYGMFYAVTAEGYSIAELKKYTEYLECELLKIDGVRRSQIFGMQMETVDIIFSKEKLATLNINPMMIAMAMQNESQIVNAGSMNFGNESIKVSIGNKLSSIKEIEDLLIEVPVPGGGNFKLSDIATVKRSTMNPQRQGLFFNGKEGLSLGLSNESGVNVVELGERMTARINELKQTLPAGIEINTIYSQPDRVNNAMNGFILNLIISIGIVIIVLLFAMGFRSGLLISSGLVFTILATLMVMLAINLPLHRVTLAAIILAMGMLVDNAIVVADGILIDLKKGVAQEKAFTSTPKKMAMPLLGATVIAILAFLPLALSPHMAGEMISSLFTVLIISLSLSWIFAMIQTPFMAKLFYKNDTSKEEKQEVYNNGIYCAFRQFISFVLKRKYISLVSVFIILISSLSLIKNIKQEFIPTPVDAQFFIEYNLPQGTDIQKVKSDILEIEAHLQTLEEVKMTAASIGTPPARYTLMRYMPTGGSGYGEIIIETGSPEEVDALVPQIDNYISSHYPNANYRVHTYGASFTDYDVEIEFTGADPKVLRELGDKARAVLVSNPFVGPINNTWRNQTKTLNPEYNVDKAQAIGLNRSDMSNALLIATKGIPIGAFYEGKTMMPIVLKLDNQLSGNISDLLSIPVWGQRSRASVPLSQIVDTVSVNWQNEVVTRINGTRSLRIQCDAVNDIVVSDLQASIKDEIESIALPDGYQLNWQGELTESDKANKSLVIYLPLALLLILLIIVALFNSIRQTIIIFLIIPFAFIGVAFGFNITGFSLNFLAVIGCLGLIGMMIKNAIVLLDQINLDLKIGKTPWDATIDSAVSRVRPVMMASITTILGMLPLITDAMFKSMAIAIMSGLAIGSIMTLVVIPIFYAVFFKVKKEKQHN